MELDREEFAELKLSQTNALAKCNFNRCTNLGGIACGFNIDWVKLKQWIKKMVVIKTAGGTTRQKEADNRICMENEQGEGRVCVLDFRASDDNIGYATQQLNE